MSYTETDVLHKIVMGLDNKEGEQETVRLLIGWYKKELNFYQINKWDCRQIEQKLKILESIQKSN